MLVYNLRSPLDESETSLCTSRDLRKRPLQIGSFIRQRDLDMRLVLGGHKTSRFHLPARILRTYTEGLSGSVMY